MTWAVTVMPTAEKQLTRIPNPDKGRILDAIAALERVLRGGMSALWRAGRTIGCVWENGVF